MKKRCVIIGAANIVNLDLVFDNVSNEDYVICADGGYDNALRAGIKVDLFVGDIDSYTSGEEISVEKIVLSKEKDDTDMMVAIKEGLCRGYKDFLILGALGQRLDHTYANLCLLKYLYDNQSSAKIVDEKTEVFLLGSGQRSVIVQKEGKIISVFPFGCNFCSLSYSGLKYPLRNEKIYIESPRGISNEVIEKSATITVYEGVALIVLSK